MSKEAQMSSEWGHALEDAQPYTPEEFHRLATTGGEIDPRRAANTVALLSSLLVFAILGGEFRIPKVGEQWLTHNAQIAQEVGAKIQRMQAQAPRRAAKGVVA